MNKSYLVTLWDAGPAVAGTARGRAARGVDHRDGGLPQAGARRDQPGRQGHNVPGGLP